MARYPTFHQTEKGGGSKTPTVTGRKGNANRARAVPEMDVWRKHEAEAVYVANSEPAIWPWEGGRAGVVERDPIYGEEARLTQGSPTALTSKVATGVRKPSRVGEPEAAREQRVADPRVVLRSQGR